MISFKKLDEMLSNANREPKPNTSGPTLSWRDSIVSHLFSEFRRAVPSGNPNTRAQTEFKPGVESWWGSRVVGERSGAPAERRRRGREFPTVTRIRTFVWVDYSKARLSARPAPLVRVGIPIKFGLTRSGLL